MACEALHVYCGASWSFRFASVWLFIIDFISISVALYGLVSYRGPLQVADSVPRLARLAHADHPTYQFVLYVLIAPELKGHKPLAKFTTVKVSPRALQTIPTDG